MFRTLCGQPACELVSGKRLCPLRGFFAPFQLRCRTLGPRTVRVSRDCADLYRERNRCAKISHSSRARAVHGTRPQMSNVECKMTKEARSQNDEGIRVLASWFDIRHSNFVIHSTFVIRV